MTNAYTWMTSAIIAVFTIGTLFFTATTTHAQTYYYTIPGSNFGGYTGQVQFHNQNQFYNQRQQQLLQIKQLLLLIEQLQAQLDGRGGFSGGGFSGNSEIDVTTNSANAIEDEEARLRGEVDFNSSDYAYLWFEWGERQNDLDEETPRIRRDDDDNENFSVLLTDLDEDQRYYFRAVGEDEDGRIDRGSIRSFTTDDRRGSRRNGDEPDVRTEDADDVDEDSAELNGEVDMNDFNNGEVFFVYGTDEDQISDVEDDFDSYGDVDEDGDDLQKIRVDADLDGEKSYSRRVSNLEEDETYYFAICVGYEDDDDDEVLACGSVEEFETDGRSSDDDEPTVITGRSHNVTDDSAEFEGEVDMNDFNNGRVFFVYGEDDEQVRDIEDDYDRYRDIDEDGDDLQKIQVDSDLDGDAEYDAEVFGLDDNTEYFYSICVEFEDEDDDDKIICGSTRSFETDN